MCFSATASFTAAAVLAPAGIYCLRVSNSLDRRYWAFAMFPFMFSLQQLIEGGVWLALEQGDFDNVYKLALGFLLFSHVFWLGWVAFSASQVELIAQRRDWFRKIAVFGLLFGGLMYVPLLLHPDWLTVAVVNHSIDYQLSLIFDSLVTKSVITLVYAAVILTPLLLSSDTFHSRLGVFTLLAGLVAWGLYEQVFISVWCYFSALISLYVFFMVARSMVAARDTNVTNKV